MKLVIIVAMDNNRVIGQRGKMPWHLPADLKHFKAVTMGKPIIMGRKTFESIGRPLPGRKNIIITRQNDYEAPGCDVTHSLDEALRLVAEVDEVMIIGGAEIFKQALPRVQKMYLTIIDNNFVGDTFFPAWDKREWNLVLEERHEADEKNPFAYRFLQLLRKS